MNKHQQKTVDEAPTSCKGILTRAYEGKGRAVAIKAFCLRCIGYVRQDVTDCTAWSCPLHPYRPYQNGQDTEDPTEIELDGAQNASGTTT